MTCIVGFFDKKTKKVTIGGDSAGVAGLDICIRKDTKVFKVGEFVIGCTSSFRMIQLLQFSFKPPDINGRDIYEYMCTDFIDGIRACFKKGGYLQTNSKGEEQGGSFLIGYRDRLFQIDIDFQVAESLNGIDAIGCGARYALGSLHTYNALKSTGVAKTKVLKALETAEFFSAGVSKPFVVYST